jgi:hypothetical protein
MLNPKQYPIAAIHFGVIDVYIIIVDVEIINIAAIFIQYTLNIMYVAARIR